MGRTESVKRRHVTFTPEMADSALPPPRSRLILERVLGLTALSNAQVAVNPVSGELAYAAGCIVVVYNLRRNKQVRYYRVDKNVACLCFSPNGQFLAIGEKGYLPAITIWDGTDGTLCAELQRHQYGVACMSFSQDGRFLLSAGLVHDQHLYAWELKRRDSARRLEVTAVGCAFVEDKILDADYCQAGNFFVTVGVKHFKYWFLDDNGSFLVTGQSVNELPELQHREATVNAKSSATFTGVGCGYGSCELKTFAVTLDGTLCCFGASGILERLVSLEANCGNAISVTESYVAVGGSSGVVRLFDPSTLEYRITLPFPPAFGAANLKLTPSLPSILYPSDPFRYPAVIATRITGSHVIVFYSDRSIFIYSTAKPDVVTIERSFLYHSGGVCDLQVVGLVRGTNAKGKLVYGENGGTSVAIIPNGTFVTCSDDNTIRLWNLELHRRPSKANRFEPTDGRFEHEFWRNPYSQEMLRVIYNDHDRDFEDEHCVVLGGTCSHNSCSTVHSPPKDHGRNKGLTVVSVRPDQKEIAAGDHEGNVVVMAVPLDKPAIRISAHNSKVNCLTYSSLNDDRPVFMASGGKDRLIHLYDCQRGHAVLSTLEKHSAAVKNVSLSHDGKTLLSCGADNSVTVSSIDVKGEATESKVVPCTGGKVFNTVLLPDSDIVVACGSNKLEVLSVSTGKLRLAHLVGEQHHVAVCPANYCVAMSGSFAEKTIHVMDLKTGDTLATGTGHGEAVTALKFTPDCRRLLSASSDGCIFVWRLGDDIQAEIKAKLPRVIEVQHPIPAPPYSTSTDHQEPVLPPPAPPLKIAGHTRDPSSPDLLPPKDTRLPVPIVPEKTTPKRASKRSPPKWKGNGIAVPGPMAGIPMEDWMKTRTTAKPTIHVIDDNGTSTELKARLKTPSNDGALVIDRLQTPDWAKTALTEMQPGTGSCSEVQVMSHEAPPHGKWGNQVAASLPSKNDVSEEKGLELTDLNFHQEANTQGKCSAPTPKAEKDDLTALSVEVSSTTKSVMSSSLALEREQLEKRKKQIDTANAVFAMNTRLSQLGLIKQQKTTPTAQPRQTGSTTQSPPKKVKAPPTNTITSATMLPSPKVQSVRQSPPKSSITAPTEVAIELPAEDRLPNVLDKALDESLGESFEMVSSPVENECMEKTQASTGVVKNMDTNLPPNGRDGGAHQATEDLVSQALRTLNSVEPPKSPPMVNVADSLSIHTSGYGPQAPSIATSTDSHSHSPLEVEVSLSNFTSGFTQPTLGREENVQRSVETVASSLSVFTAGYTGQDHKRSPNESIVVTAAGSAVAESISTFTSGYSTARCEDPAKIPQQVPVDISLSSFTSGYETGKLEVDVHSKSNVEGPKPLPVTKASLSTFTSGYGAVVSPMSIGKTTTSKSVDIQPPSPLDAPDNNPTSSKSTKGTTSLETKAQLY
ncbi:Mitogen-activated protein kinase-binding protein 1 [Phytophthora citrophthora]|uniref:Mitogen-activated protein kinase-binding protein 1 n=1 Tax=Phytophthora citrophthora TaxID=4793 RepID=A0AAD9LP74_9STRA|nr:Mitogen-activated protein kinase-binding protein 1 [Phytophthora citrophthora]